MNQEVTGPLNYPAERAAGLQDLGLPRNLLPTPAGWGHRQQPQRSPCPQLNTAGNVVQRGSRSPFETPGLWESWERGCSPALGAAPGQQGVSTQPREIDGVGVGDK